MAEPRTLGSYGGPFQDEAPVENPQTQTSAALYNRKAEDTAQMTRTFWRAIVRFVCVADAPTFILPPAQVFIRTAWGDSATFKPVVTKTGTGLYSIQFAAAYNDGLGVSESVQWFDAMAVGRTATATDDPEGTRVLTVGSNLITIVAKDAGVAADQAASTNFIVITTYIT